MESKQVEEDLKFLPEEKIGVIEGWMFRNREMINDSLGISIAFLTSYVVYRAMTRILS